MINVTDEAQQGLNNLPTITLDDLLTDEQQTVLVCLPLLLGARVEWNLAAIKEAQDGDCHLLHPCKVFVRLKSANCAEIESTFVIDSDGGWHADRFSINYGALATGLRRACEAQRPNYLWSRAAKRIVFMLATKDLDQRDEWDPNDHYFTQNLLRDFDPDLPTPYYPL